MLKNYLITYLTSCENLKLIKVGVSNPDLAMLFIPLCGHGVPGLLLEDKHVLSEGVLVGAGDEAVVPVEDAQRHVVGVAVHQPHQETVVPEMNEK